MGKMLEQEIKTLLINHLKGRQSSLFDGVIVSEFFFDNFKRRADLLIIKDDKFHVYEIKSEFDNLNRLSGQIEQYLKYFDKVTVVAPAKHIGNISNNTESFVEILKIEDNGGFKIVRKGKLLRNNDKTFLLKLLKIRELKSLAKKLKIKTIGRNREGISLELLKLSKVTLKKYVASCVANRYKYSSEALKLSCSNSEGFYRSKKFPLNSDVNKMDSNNIIEARKPNEDRMMLEMQKKSIYPIFGKVPQSVIELLAKK